jgi:hypothetical protein
MSVTNYKLNRNGRKSRLTSLFISIIANTLIIGFFFILFSYWSLPSLLGCFDPSAQNFLSALFALLTLHLFSGAISNLNTGPIGFYPKQFFEILGTKILMRNYKIGLFVFVMLALLAYWLASYTVSPLNFPQDDIPVLAGFVVKTDNNLGDIGPNQVVSIKGSSQTSLIAVTDPLNARCMWSSANGGSFKTPSNCETTYIPPLDESVDLLQIQIRSACQFQESYGHLRINILP